MSNAATLEIEIDKIDIDGGLNARSEMDEGRLAELGGSLGSDGFVQPLAVRPGKDGRVFLVAGHRRLEGAKREGLKKVPIAFTEVSPHLASFLENAHREGLNPVDEARGLKAVMEERGITTIKKLAAKTRKSPEWVGERLRLLALPDDLQRFFADGSLPIEAERPLRGVAEASPEVARWVCEVAQPRQLTGRQFVQRFPDLLREASRAEGEGKPTMLWAHQFPLSAVVSEPEQHQALAERLNALEPHYRPKDPSVRLAEAEVDAARAAGCLVEHVVNNDGWTTSTAFIADKGVALDLVERQLERREQEARDAAEAKKAERKAAKGKAGAGAKEGEKTPYQVAKEMSASARAYNDSFGVKVLKARTKGRREQQSLARAKAVAALLIADNPKLAGRGLRLALPQVLQEVEVKQLKSGGSKEKVAYADAEQSQKELERRVDAAGTAEEVLEVLAEAVLAAIVTDQDEVPKNKRIDWSPPYAAEPRLRKLLASDLKATRPRRRKVKSS